MDGNAIPNAIFLMIPTHLLRRTLIPIIVPVENERLLLRRRFAMRNTISVRHLMFLVRNAAETVQSPQTRRPPHAHTPSGRSVAPIRIFGILEFPLVRHFEFANTV